MIDLTTVGTSIDGLDRPAMIIDVERSEICSLNPLARRLWGLDNAELPPIALDRAMPAVVQLAEVGQDAEERLLVFWTAKGSQNLRCVMRQLPDRNIIIIFNDIGSPSGSLKSQFSSGDGSDQSEPITEAVPRKIDLRTMAHELRTPMAAVIALAEMIEREQFGPVGDARYLEYARDIGDSARLTLSIVAAALENDIPNGRMLPGGFAEIDVHEHIIKCYRTVRQTAEEARVILDVELDDGLPKLIANGPAFTQILLNLLTNAIKFTPEGGRIVVAAGCDQSGVLVVTVSDTGVGMTGTDTRVLVVDDQSDLCHGAGAGASKAAGVTTKGGIGFSLVKRLAAAMGATIDVTSTRGIGTRVAISFPQENVIPTVPSILG
jgi:signal transduction histidine kinase